MVKEAQFQVERQCPIQFPGDTQAEWWAKALPLCFWVHLEERRAAPCGGKSFRIMLDRLPLSSDGRQHTLKEAPPGFVFAICEHMGHLIE